MRRGTNISPYIPKGHYNRYRVLEEICYSWRKDEGARTRVKMGKKGLEVWKKQSGEDVYTQVPNDSLGKLPEVAMIRREDRQEDRSLTISLPTGRPGYTPPPGRGQQGKRDRSKSSTKSPDSRSPPNKKTDEGYEREKSNDRIEALE